MTDLPFTLDQLRILKAIASEGSFKKAAESLYISQPAVSLQVQNLEKQLNELNLKSIKVYRNLSNHTSNYLIKDKVFKENQKGYKAQRVNKKKLTPKPPKGKKPKKSSKKKSKYQDFVSKKLKEYKSLDIPQPEKMKKAAAEWKKFKSA